MDTDELDRLIKSRLAEKLGVKVSIETEWEDVYRDVDLRYSFKIESIAVSLEFDGEPVSKSKTILRTSR